MFRKYSLLSLSCLLVILLTAIPSASENTIHTFKITAEEAHHGWLESTIPPVLTINDGDTVIFNTLTLFEGNVRSDMTFEELMAARDALMARSNTVYALTGPFYITGAEPGDVLEIRINRIVPAAWGATWIYPDHMGLGGLSDGSGNFEEGWFRSFYFCEDRKTVEFMPGVTLQLAPIVGTMALAPRPGERYHPAPPNYFGGNMDNRELVAGTTLFIPVNVPGALFMAGDGHAVQGDGEVSISALEAALDEVELQFIVRRDMTLNLPIAETPTHWITMGFHQDLNEAMRIAIRETIDFLSNNKGMTREEAFALSSMAVDFRVTQVVNGSKGIHGMIPKSIFTE